MPRLSLLLALLFASSLVYGQMPAPVIHHFISDKVVAQNLDAATQILDTLSNVPTITPALIDEICQQIPLNEVKHYSLDFFLGANIDTTINFGFGLTFRAYFFNRGNIALSYLSYDDKVLVIQMVVELLASHYQNKEAMHRFGMGYLAPITISDTIKRLLIQNKFKWQKKPQRIAYEQFFTTNMEAYHQKEPIRITASPDCGVASVYLNTPLEMKIFSLGNTRGLLEMEQLMERGNTTCVQELLYSPNPTVRLFAYHQYLQLLKVGLVYDQATLKQMKKIASSQNDVLIGLGCSSKIGKNQECINRIHSWVFREEKTR